VHFIVYLFFVLTNAYILKY